MRINEFGYISRSYNKLPRKNDHIFFLTSSLHVGHINVPKRLQGKRVMFKMEEVKEKKHGSKTH